MALLSRPSLRGSVRRNTHDHSRKDGRPPPMKRQRTLEEYGMRHRRSSPDCLDTTTTQEMNPVGNPRPVKPPLKSARPQTSTRRARRHSSSSIDSLVSEVQLKTPSQPLLNGNGSARNIRVPDRSTPSAVQRLRDAQESPDPLDTISPAVATTPTRTRSRGSAQAPVFENKPTKTSPKLTRVTRHNESEPKTVVTDVVEKQETEVKSDHLDEAGAVAATRSQQKQKSEVAETEQPPAAQAVSERRSLRSADTSSRSKSELAQYFYNYEQIISLESPKPVVETLSANTIIALVDDLSEPLPFPSSPDPMPFGNPLDKLYNCEVISLPTPSKQRPEDDPLNEELYFRAHRRFERQEKQLRNIERDRAQHEKQQLDRLLEELRSQDWLRVMGLPGVHESEKKLYEPKRQILIQELVALLTKFQVWKDEERRRKLTKEKSVPPVDTEIESRRSRKRSRPAEESEEQESSLTPGPDTPSTPDSNDVDALAARQLHQEARSASDSAAKNRKSTSKSRKPKPKSADEDSEKTNITDKKDSQKRPKYQHPDPSPPPADPVPLLFPPPDDKPFTSFFSDPHEREIALSAIPGNREERTRRVLAFGQPIPEVEEQEFQPPEELITEEALQASQRQRRLLKRRSYGKSD